MLRFSQFASITHSHGFNFEPILKILLSFDVHRGDQSSSNPMIKTDIETQRLPSRPLDIVAHLVVLVDGERRYILILHLFPYF